MSLSSLRSSYKALADADIQPSSSTNRHSFQNSLLAPLFYAHFLRLRYYHSAFTRQAVDGVIARLDGLVAGQSPAVKNAYGTAKGVVRKWAGSVLTKKEDGPAPAAAAAAGRR